MFRMNWDLALVLQYQPGSGLIALPTLASEIYFQECLMILMLIALTNRLPKALNAFSRFHSVVIRLMLPLLLIYLNIRTRWVINQLCHPMHLPSGMLKKHVMPSHFKRTMFFSRRIQLYRVLLLQGPANRPPQQAWRLLAVWLRYYLHSPIIKQFYCLGTRMGACRVSQV